MIRRTYVIFITHQATESRGYINKTHFRGLKILDFLLVHRGGLSFV
ncbi:hypothetical protein [Nostoc sp. NMS8]|nr:hypothetical protein [Nostoc sp. NMS8]MBN3958678.1 hypothetical protein [Nostoc sp. NMS8]